MSWKNWNFKNWSFQVHVFHKELKLHKTDDYTNSIPEDFISSSTKDFTERSLALIAKRLYT